MGYPILIFAYLLFGALVCCLGFRGFDGLRAEKKAGSTEPAYRVLKGSTNGLGLRLKP